MAVKTIRIGDKDINMKASAYTMFAYKDQMGHDLLKDIKKITEIEKEVRSLPKEEQAMAWLDRLSEIIDIALQLAYIMTKEQSKETPEYEDWIKGIETMTGSDTGWISEVIKLAMSPLLGRLQSSQSGN